VADEFVFDACAVIAYLNDEEGADKVEELLWESNQKLNTLFIHEINLLEIYYGVYRDEGEQLAEETYDKIINLPIKVITGMNKNVFKAAGRFKAIYRISLADSIALAEAKVRKISLVTCDHHEFDPIEKNNELSIFWIR
jgi:uncharacterized protein